MNKDNRTEELSTADLKEALLLLEGKVIQERITRREEDENLNLRIEKVLSGLIRRIVALESEGLNAIRKRDVYHARSCDCNNCTTQRKLAYREVNK